jgi:hypothetical protein
MERMRDETIMYAGLGIKRYGPICAVLSGKSEGLEGQGQVQTTRLAAKIRAAWHFRSWPMRNWYLCKSSCTPKCTDRYLAKVPCPLSVTIEYTVQAQFAAKSQPPRLENGCQSRDS